MRRVVVTPARRAAFGAAMLLLIASVAVFSGCVGYKLGDPTTLPFSTIHVAPPVNTSLAPQASAALGASIVRELDRSGRVRTTGQADAEVQLVVTITDLRREISAERSDDTGLGRKWRITLSAECTLSDGRTGREYFARRVVSAFDEVYADSGLVAAEYQNMPVLAQRLGQSIAREVLAVW